MYENTFHYGDNLKIFRDYIPDNSIDFNLPGFYF